MSTQIPPSAPARGMLRALRHRNFRLFFGGQLVSVTGTWMQSIAQSWLVYRLTGSTVLLGVVGFAGQIPVFLLAPLTGVIADRHRKQRIVIATQIASMILALVLAALTLTGTVQVWHVIALASCLGIVNAFDIPARQAFIVELVGKDDLMNAIALNSSMFNGARVVGPSVAGLIVASIGEGWCFFANGMSYIASIAALLFMALPHAPRLDQATSHLVHGVEGFRYAGRTAPVRALLLMLGLVSVVGMPYAVLMPVFAAEILHGGPRALGLLMGSTGVGALLGALTLARREGVHGLGKVVAAAAAGFGIALVLFSFSRWFWLSAAFLVLTGYCLMLQMASTNTLVQSMVPDRLRGRVMAIYAMMFLGMAPFGALLAGFVARSLGAPLTVAAGGAISLLGAALFASRLPSLRREARELLTAQGIVFGEPADGPPGP